MALAEFGEVNIDQPIVDPVQHLESVVEPALFKTVSLQTVEQLFNGTGCSVSEIVASIPCCSTLYLLLRSLLSALIFVKILTTFSSRWASFCLWGSQAVEAYSSVGRTLVV